MSRARDLSGAGPGGCELLIALGERYRGIANALDVGPLRLAAQLSGASFQLRGRLRRVLQPLLHESDEPAILVANVGPLTT